MMNAAEMNAEADPGLAHLALGFYGASLGTTTFEAALRRCVEHFDADIAIHALHEAMRAEPLERTIITRERHAEVANEAHPAETATGPRAIGFIVPVRPGMQVHLHLARVLAPFPTTAGALLATLAPHLRRAIVARLRINAESTSTRLSAEAFETLGLAAARYGHDARFLGANAALMDLATRRDGIVLGAGGISGVERAETAALASAIAGVLADGSDHAGLRLRRIGLSVPYVLSVRAAAGRVIVTVADPAAATLHDPSLLGSLLGEIFGLSEAQASLAAALARGTPLAAYARSAGIAFETARSRLKAVLARTGCRRQADLCALLARLEM